MRRLKLIQLVWLVLVILGCSSGGEPVAPPTDSLSLTEGNRDSVSQSGLPEHSGRYLWSYHQIYIDPSTLEFEVTPVREAAAHWNILSLLEKNPCNYCLKVTSIIPSGTGTLFLTIQIINPYFTPAITGFDVRGIAMFDASHLFPASGLKYPDRAMGDIVVVNPEGYTTLYNPTTAGSGPAGMQGYIKGNMATETPPNGRLNAFKRFISEGDENTRNAFYANDAVKVTYEIAMPATPFLFGYAVDANWALPLKTPVINPITDFGPEANCPEAWMIKLVKTDPIGSGMSSCGGQSKLTFDIYDWQGVDSAHLPRLECPELFDGEVEATWKADGPGFSRYEAIMENVKHAPAGSYFFLIRKEAKENDPVGKPWLDLGAYQVFEVSLYNYTKQPPTAVCEANEQYVIIGEGVFFDASGSHDNDCEGEWITKYEWQWEEDGEFVEGPSMILHAWDTEGIFKVQVKVTDDEGQQDMLGQPLVIGVSEQGFNPVEVTPPWLNFAPRDICVDGNRLYIAAGEQGLHIFEIGTPTSLTWLGWVDISEANFVEAEGDYAHVAEDSVLVIIDVSQPLFAHAVKSINASSYICGLVVSDGYAFLTGNESLEIADISNPESASIVKTVDMEDDAFGLDVEGGYAYVATDDDGLQVVDIDPVEDASIVKTIPLPGEARNVTVSGGYAFVANSTNRLQIVDIDPLESAVPVCDVATVNKPLSVAVSNGYAYVMCGKYGFQVINVTQPESAYSVKVIGMPGEVHELAISGNYAYVADTYAGIPIVDISDPESAEIAATKGSALSPFSIELQDHLAFLASGYAGLQILNISSPECAWITRSVDTPGFAWDVAVANGYAYIADDQELQIIDIAPPESAFIEKALEMPSGVERIAYYAGYVGLTSLDQLFIVDVDPVNSAHLVKQLEIPNNSDHFGTPIAISGGFAFINTSEGFQIVDVIPPENACIVKVVPTSYGWPVAVSISGNYAYITDNAVGVNIIDISKPESALIVKYMPLFQSRGIALSGGYAFVDDYDLDVIDVDPPEDAFILLNCFSDLYGWDLAVSGKYIYHPGYVDGLRIFKLW